MLCSWFRYIYGILCRVTFSIADEVKFTDVVICGIEKLQALRLCKNLFDQ